MLLGLLTLLATAAPAAERLLGAPVYDSEAETTYRQITWDDFKSRSEGRNYTKRMNWVVTVTAIRLGGFEVATSRQDDGEWVAVPVGVRPYAVMDKFLSGASRGGRTRAMLAHQQRLFDLAEAVARQLAVDLRGLRGHGEVPYDAESALRYRIGAEFDRRRAELNELQELYVSETSSGDDRKKTREWAQKIAAMFEQATAELTAALDSSAE